jgi:hypothetical protein
MLKIILLIFLFSSKIFCITIEEVDKLVRDIRFDKRSPFTIYVLGSIRDLLHGQYFLNKINSYHGLVGFRDNGVLLNVSINLTKEPNGDTFSLPVTLFIGHSSDKKIYNNLKKFLRLQFHKSFMQIKKIHSDLEVIDFEELIHDLIESDQNYRDAIPFFGRIYEAFYGRGNKHPESRMLTGYFIQRESSDLTFDLFRNGRDQTENNRLLLKSLIQFCFGLMRFHERKIIFERIKLSDLAVFQYQGGFNFFFIGLHKIKFFEDLKIKNQNLTPEMLKNPEEFIDIIEKGYGYDFKGGINTNENKLIVIERKDLSNPFLYNSNFPNYIVPISPTLNGESMNLVRVLFQYLNIQLDYHNFEVMRRFELYEVYHYFRKLIDKYNKTDSKDDPEFSIKEVLNELHRITDIGIEVDYLKQFDEQLEIVLHEIERGGVQRNDNALNRPMTPDYIV